MKVIVTVPAVVIVDAVVVVALIRCGVDHALDSYLHNKSLLLEVLVVVEGM